MKKNTKNAAAKKRAKKNTKKPAAPKYTRLDFEDVGEIIANALGGTSATFYAEVAKHFELEEHEDYPGTFFVWFEARRKCDADALSILLKKSAAARGCKVENNITWGDALEAGSVRRHVEYYITAADFMTEHGRAVA